MRDYARLVEEDMPNEAFDATFSLQPRNPDQPAIELPPLAERFYVVPCDPTQAQSIAQAQTGESYIIQGPPGTGKSQTITNLIADFVARGKRVLFVCEKRAAIDVVYLRLKQQGLDDLCSLIHDSQADKKSFVMDLKATYEGLLKDDDSHDADKQRQQQITAVERELQPLEAFHQAMREKTEDTGIPVRQLLQRVVELNQKTQLTDLEKERLPHFALWNQHRESIERFDGALREVQPDGVLSQHPLRCLRTKLAADERPLERITTNLDRATQLLEQLRQLTDGELTDSIWQPIQRAIETVALARKLEFLAENRLCKLLDASSPPAGQFVSDTRDRQSHADALSRAEEKTNAWREKLPSAEVGPALSQAQQMEGSLLRWLQPAWWRLRGIVLKRYDFSTHVVKPTISHVLTELAAEHDAVQKLNTIDDRLRQQYAFSGDVHQFVERVARASEELKSDETGLGETLLALGTPDQIVLNLIAAGKSLDQLCGHLDAFMQDYDQHNWEALRDDLQSIDDSLDGLTDFLICLSELAGLPANISEALRNLPLNATSIEAAVADRTLQQALRSTRAIERYDGATRRRTVERLEKHYDAWQTGNAVAVRQVVQNRFREHMRITTLTASEMTGDQKEFKKQYNKGRRELEHEFGKSMRYKSIRDLVAGDSGRVVRDLKPVWLMSPLSVSDTLPLSPDEFDVVIFDEASQITLEEAVPSLFRARQAIVVGDQMQLPPTNFFSAKRAEDDEQLIFEEEDEQVEYDLDSDSFLNHAARNLSSTMLGWHYRSRSESLISFSNWAFYQGRLLTVPEERLAEQSVSELRVTSATDGEHGAHELLRRPVSFHRLDHGVYENRRNRSEADYIAQMVRTLLLEDSGVSIGIVAFSEAQQGTIEDALARLAREDEPFADALEAEWEREQDGEFCGLLVKNLENIQGDERDVIIMSVCYGRDPQGKMRMNFGPINKSGGEKRLNVAFSRARHHMVLVSSIQASEITNDYNTGANCLKNYINYAAAVSIGKMDVAQRILRDMTLTGEADSHKTATQNDAVCDQLEFELKQRGLIVDRGVGQSHFRCDLAIRREEDRSYRLGILVDTEEFYSEENLIETEMMRPRLLRNFGWTLTHVLAKDWHEDREEVLQRLIESL